MGIITLHYPIQKNGKTVKDKDMSLSDLIPSFVAAYAPATQPSYQRVHITVEEENCRLRAALAAQGALLQRHQDALLKDIIDQISALLKKHPDLRKEIRAALKGKEPTKGSLLNSLNTIVSKPVEKQDNEEWVVVVDPRRDLTLLLNDFKFLAHLPTLMPALEEKIDLEGILCDMHKGGTSTLFHIGNGICVTGSYLYRSLSLLFRITRITISTISLVVYNPVIRATIIASGQILSAT
jgi:hypothetical protein